MEPLRAAVSRLLVAACLLGPLFPDRVLTGGGTILRHLVICEERAWYCAWPSMARTASGDLVVLFCRSEEHLGPDGAIMLCRSTDNGKTWAPPRVIVDTPLDERESGCTTLQDGRILAHVWSTAHTPEGYRALPEGAYEPAVLSRWMDFVRRPEYVRARVQQGAWEYVSRDNGHTWDRSAPGVDAVHGGVQLRDGSLLCAGYRQLGDSIGVFKREGLALAWKQVAIVGSPRPDSLAFGEPHLLQLRSGRIIMMIRATARPYNDGDPRCVLWETYSDDGGTTWVPAYPTPLWGFPPHLAQLADGRTLCTYGYRRPPFGQRACTSKDGIRWSLRDETILRDDAPNGDLGYPESLEIEPGTILTVYYQPDVPRGTVQQMHPPDPGRVKPGILGTIWTVR